MTVRTWWYGRLTGYAALTALVGDDNPRVYAKKSMTSSNEAHPFIVYKLGFSANEMLAEELPEGKTVARQFAQVWVHDYSDTQSGDYNRIDQVLREVRAALHQGSSAADGVILCQYIETSQDLNDETLNTVMKYARFEIKTEER